MPGLPKKYIKKYGVSKAAWRAYRAARGRRSRSRPRKAKSVPSRRRRAYRRVRRAASRARNPLIGYLMFAGGAYGGEVLTDNYMRPWMSRNKYLANSMIGQGAVLLGASYMLRKFTSGKRGVQNVGQGASAYMAAKGMGLLIQTLKGSAGG